MGEQDLPFQPRRDRLIQERVHDADANRLKPVEASVCPRCGAVFEADRWHWGTVPGNAAYHLCQACHRIEDRFPAGEIRLSGAYLVAHREEILGLVHNQEAAEAAEHPLHRIMWLEERPDEMTIATTDVHLPHRIGQAVRRACKGTLSVHYDAGRCFARVHWHRDT